MIQKVQMPKLGQTMEEAVVEKWHKQEGDPVAKGDVLLEIQTDKATLEVESFSEGTFLKRVAQEGESFPVNSVIAFIGDPDDEVPDVEALREEILSGESGPAAAPEPAAAEAPAPPEAEPQPAAAPQPQAPPAPEPSAEGAEAPAPAEGRVFSSPRARRVAEEEKVPLRLLRGSGPNGRIVEKDVLAYAETVRELKATPTARAVAFEKGMDLRSVKGTGPGGKITREDVLAAAAGAPAPAAAAPAPAPAAAPAAAPVPGEAVPLSAMRRIVAERMAASKRDIPHFYLTAEADMAAAMALRQEINAQGRGKVAFHDLLVKACSIALAEQPAMNVSFQEGGLVRRQEINIGLAVAIEDGLMVPVVRNVDRLSLLGVADASRQLIDKTRGKKLVPEEYEGGCLTVSNLGMYDVDWFYPIINPGEPAILGVGRIADRVVARDGGIHVRPVMTLALCADHRAVDGAMAAGFLQRVKGLLEAPSELK